MNKNRVEMFSDGIVVIIVTLLVLELKVPHIENPFSSWELFYTLVELSPKIISLAVSFLTICVIWLNHHEIFSLFKIIDHKLFWLNAGLLLFISLIPFPTAVIGDYPNNKTAAMLYGLVMTFASGFFAIIRIYAVANKKEIMKDDINIENFKMGTRYAIIFGPVLYATGAITGLISPYISIAIYGFIVIYFILPYSRRL